MTSLTMDKLEEACKLVDNVGLRPIKLTYNIDNYPLSAIHILGTKYGYEFIEIPEYISITQTWKERLFS